MAATNTMLKNRVMLKIRQASDLPAMADTVNVINKFKASEDTSVTDLANILLKDYALTTKILKVVNSVHYLQSGKVTTISRAIFLMGVDQIKNIATTLMLFDQLQKRGAHTEIMDAIIQAFCGGVIAQKIVQDLNYVEEEEAFICALLHPLGKIIVAHAMPDKTAEIRHMSAERGISEDAASLAVLGVSYEEIGTTIATEWNYPQTIVQSMHNTAAADLQAEPEESQKLSMIATLSSEMSNILSTDTEREDKTVKMKTALSAYSGLIPTQKKNIDKLISSSVKEFNELAATLNLNLKNSTLSKQLDRWTTDAQQTAADSEVLSFKTESLKSVDTLFTNQESDPESIFSKGIQDINNSMLGPCALNDILRIALETIYLGMKASQVIRVLFFVRDITKPVMDIRLGFGMEVNEVKKWFTIALGEPRDVFNMAIARDEDLIVRNTESTDIRKFIPLWYRSNIPVAEYLLLFPVTINKKNIGLISIEGDPGGFESITRVHLNYLRILRDQAVIATTRSFRQVDKR